MEKEPLFAQERQKEILALLEAEQKVLVPQLCRQFSVSPATIRNDLNDLEAPGVAPPHSRRSDPAEPDRTGADDGAEDRTPYGGKAGHRRLCGGNGGKRRDHRHRYRHHHPGTGAMPAGAHRPDGGNQRLENRRASGRAVRRDDYPHRRLCAPWLPLHHRPAGDAGDGGTAGWIAVLWPPMA